MNMNWGSPQLVGILIAIVVVMEIVSIIEYGRKGRLIYGVKRAWHRVSWWLGILALAYILFGGIAVMPSIVSWTNRQPITSELGEIVIRHGMLLAWATGIVIVAVIVMIKIGTSWKYNEVEKQWIRDEKEKILRRFPNLPKWLQKIL